MTSPPLPPLQNRIRNHIRKIYPAVIPHNTLSVVSYPIVDRESPSHECNVLILSNRRAFRISKQNIYLFALHSTMQLVQIAPVQYLTVSYRFRLLQKLPARCTALNGKLSEYYDSVLHGGADLVELEDLNLNIKILVR